MAGGSLYLTKLKMIPCHSGFSVVVRPSYPSSIRGPEPTRNRHQKHVCLIFSCCYLMDTTDCLGHCLSFFLMSREKLMCRAPYERHDFMAFDIRIAYLLVVAVGGIHLWVFIWRRRTGKEIEIILTISFYPILPTTTPSCTFPNHPLPPYPLPYPRSPHSPTATKSNKYLLWRQKLLLFFCP
jgi:hypothetical protein